MVIPIEWLEKKVSVAEAEAANPGISDERVACSPEAAKPFGFLHNDWEALKAAMRPGDDLWRSPPNDSGHGPEECAQADHGEAGKFGARKPPLQAEVSD
jgi:hypothetical protein